MQNGFALIWPNNNGKNVYTICIHLFVLKSLQIWIQIIYIILCVCVLCIWCNVMLLFFLQLCVSFICFCLCLEIRRKLYKNEGVFFSSRFHNSIPIISVGLMCIKRCFSFSNRCNFNSLGFNYYRNAKC